MRCKLFVAGYSIQTQNASQFTRSSYLKFLDQMTKATTQKSVDIGAESHCLALAVHQQHCKGKTQNECLVSKPCSGFREGTRVKWMSIVLAINLLQIP